MVVRVNEQGGTAQAARARHDVEAGHDLGCLEQHRRHKDTRRAIVDRRCQAFGERVGRPRRNFYDLETFLGKTIELPPDGVELAVGGHELRASSERQRGQQARDELVRVLPERDVAVGAVQQPPKPRLHARRLLGRTFPLRIYELRRIQPRLLLGLEPDIGPRLMRVAGEQEALGDAEATVMLRQWRRHFRVQISEFRLISDCDFVIGKSPIQSEL